MTEKQRTPIAFFLVTKFHFVCPDCMPEDTKGIITFYEEKEIIGYYNDLHIGFRSHEHEIATDGRRLIISCEHCNKNLAEGSLTHEFSDMFD